jgi:hypothetical protein
MCKKENMTRTNVLENSDTDGQIWIEITRPLLTEMSELNF